MPREDFIEKVVETAKKYNRTISDDELLNEVVEEVIDRVSLYLNMQENDDFDARLVRVVSRIVSGVFNQTNANIDNDGGQEMAVTAISDNGQSISYSSSKVKTYLATTEDDELFSGFAALLKNYRRINVVS